MRLLLFSYLGKNGKYVQIRDLLELECTLRRQQLSGVDPEVLDSTVLPSRQRFFYYILQGIEYGLSICSIIDSRSLNTYTNTIADKKI